MNSHELSVPHPKEIAVAILKHIQTQDPAAFVAWGAKGFAVLPAAKIEINGMIRGQQGGIQFNVEGTRFQGVIIIRLMASKLYTVELGKGTPPNGHPVERVSEVFLEEVISAVDRLMEKSAPQTNQ
jgi:hypothetical protein